jgi:hypothetical protein
LERIWKEALIDVPSQHLPVKTEESRERRVRIASVPAEIRIEDLLNSSLERYRYVNPFSGAVSKHLSVSFFRILILKTVILACIARGDATAA